MNLVDVETERKFPIPPPPPKEEEENEVKPPPPPPIGPNGVNPTEKMMMINVQIHKKSGNLTQKYFYIFTGHTQINIPVLNPEKAGPNGENPGKNESVVLLLLTPL